MENTPALILFINQMQTMVVFENICSVCFVSQLNYENFGAALNYQYQFNYKHFL